MDMARAQSCNENLYDRWNPKFISCQKSHHSGLYYTQNGSLVKTIRKGLTKKETQLTVDRGQGALPFVYRIIPPIQ